MQKLLLILALAVSSSAYSQLGVAFHQSNLPFFAVNYELKSRIRPELRIGIDNYIEALPFEAVATYDFLRKNDYQFYGGLGVRVHEPTGGIVVPVGLNVYPFNENQFGFHIELAPIIGEDFLLRGSWGIRYRFKKR